MVKIVKKSEKRKIFESKSFCPKYKKKSLKLIVNAT